MKSRAQVWWVLAIVGSALVALGSVWRFGIQNGPFWNPVSQSGNSIIEGVPPARYVSLSSWVTIALVVSGLLAFALAAEAAATRHRQRPIIWSLLVIATLQAVAVVAVGVWSSGTTLSPGSGYYLVAAGSGLVLVASTCLLLGSRVDQYGRRSTVNPRAVRATA
jgi:hypothetical protein